jgi:putative tricarboxylic transport membrane protein
MGVFGLALATIGTDPQVGNARFTFGQLWLLDGIQFLVLAVALFGVGEVLASAESGVPPAEVEGKLSSAWPTYADWVASRWAILRGTLVGFFVGVLPGAGATISSFMAYSLEKRVSKHPERFGHGAIEGVAGPESANNASSAGAMVPMFALGIPGSNTTAIMLGALVMFGLRPGPQLFETNPDLVWGIIASMFIGNLMLLVLNLPLAGLSVLLLRVRYTFLYPAILAICIAGIYSQSNSVDDLYFMVAFGLLGYFMKRYDYPAAPLVLGLVLEPLLENALRQSLTLSSGNPTIFVTRPISGLILLVTAVAILWPLLTLLRRRLRGSSTAPN